MVQLWNPVSKSSASPWNIIGSGRQHGGQNRAQSTTIAAAYQVVKTLAFAESQAASDELRPAQDPAETPQEPLPGLQPEPGHT